MTGTPRFIHTLGKEDLLEQVRSSSSILSDKFASKLKRPRTERKVQFLQFELVETGRDFNVDIMLLYISAYMLESCD